MSISEIAKTIHASPTLALNEKAAILREKGDPVIHLGGGERSRPGSPRPDPLPLLATDNHSQDLQYQRPGDRDTPCRWTADGAVRGDLGWYRRQRATSGIGDIFLQIADRELGRDQAIVVPPVAWAA